MSTKDKLKYLLKKRVVMLDGAMGTELHKRGMPQGVVPEIWALENPEILKQIHGEYVKAGSDIIYTSTFGANRIKLREHKIKNVKEVNRGLCCLAKEAAGKNCFVAGDIGPLGEFIKPFGGLDFEEAVDIFKEQVKALIFGGADLFVIETMMDIQEARAALIAVRELCDKFTIVTMTFELSGRTLNGTTPLSALITLQSLGADAVGANCSTGPSDMLKVVSALKPYAKVFLAAKPNAGLPKLVNGHTTFDMSPVQFGGFAQKFVLAGINMFGGCCGTTPEHIYEAKHKIINKKPVMLLRDSLSALSSARGSLILENHKAVLVAGESINPTGKPDFQQELKTGKVALVKKFAKEQESSGARLLDVNVGMPEIDEVKTMIEAISALALITELPLVIDSSNIKVIEKALRFYPGRALINSISAEGEKIRLLLPVAKKYGAMFIALPIAGKSMPVNFQERKKIIEKIFNTAKKAGFNKQDIIVDGLVMTVSSKPKAALEVLKTIEWCKKVFKAATIIGLSNISFGLPKRSVINTTFLNMAKERGLTLAIANPLQNKKTVDKLAKNLLLDKANSAAKYIKHYSGVSVVKEKTSAKKLSLKEEISLSIIEGNRQDIASFIHKALNDGENPLAIMQEVMIPAIVKVGELFEKKEYFLPQLISSAETMKKAAEILRPCIKGKSEKSKHAIIMLATVEGDIHDIGKNIVALLLENHGFKIVDLGKDVSCEKIIKAIKIHKPDIVGLSALMTTTMVNMKKILEQARLEKLNCKFMIGGAVVTRDYAEKINAAYAKDGVQAVSVARSLTSLK
ncbi:MAG: homocysteine S-methyltransferase family protein [Candidatus Omnitrophota bacterium]